MRNPIFDGCEPEVVGLKLVVVEPGTKITDERTGQSEIVSENGAVKAGNTMYCTKPVYDRLVAEFSEAPGG